MRSLYGLKQSGRLWNKNVIKFFTEILGFVQLNGNVSTIIRNDRTSREISTVSIYVDDLLMASNKEEFLISIKSLLSRQYNVKDFGETKTIIGWQVTRDVERGTMKIVESAYIRDLLEEEDLSDCKSVNIPMKAGSTIDMAEPDDYEEADLKSYQRLIGKLMYLSCATRPDIAFVITQLSRHHADPRAGYMHAAKRVV